MDAVQAANSGHPERDRVHVTPGVEVTTGPLGQGFGNGVGMAMAERFLRERYGREVQDHHVFAIVSDCDLMEGLAAEAASLAGHLGLGRIVYLYDDNRISLDGPTTWSYEGEDVTKRFEAYRWHVQDVDDANDLSALEVAIDKAMREEERPSLIRVHSIIGWATPTPTARRSGTRRGRGGPSRASSMRCGTSTGARTNSRRARPARRRWRPSRRACRRWSAARPTCRSRRRPSSRAATTSATRVIT